MTLLLCLVWSFVLCECTVRDLVPFRSRSAKRRQQLKRFAERIEKGSAASLQAAVEERERILYCSQLAVMPDEIDHCYTECGQKCPDTKTTSTNQRVLLVPAPELYIPCLSNKIPREKIACMKGEVVAEEMAPLVLKPHEESVRSVTETAGSMPNLVVAAGQMASIARARQQAAEAPWTSLTLKPDGSLNAQPQGAPVEEALYKHRTESSWSTQSIIATAGGTLLGLVVIVGGGAACCLARETDER
eukprot:Gregarina_sp_Poly_1__10949@NODE_860_length_5945_cov_36_349779_g622_i0_p4_GENE_NODE_860_length_5945_cov_36_349779_g622_i0NODE_860_length_5945_cov_36_349779_g622_i0_p4_ORF_typecomplete_len246_score27_82_NODE_860_length_5945_cov_36_349779_g622_i055792